MLNIDSFFRECLVGFSKITPLDTSSCNIHDTDNYCPLSSNLHFKSQSLRLFVVCSPPPGFTPTGGLCGWNPFQGLLWMSFSLMGLLVCVCYMLLSHLRLLVTLWMYDVYNVLSSRALLSPCRLSLWLLHGVNSSHIWSCFPLFPSIIVFSKEPSFDMMCPK